MEKRKNDSHFVNDVKKLNQTRHVRNVTTDFIQIVKNIGDPRTRHCDYPLHEILFIAIVAVLCGADSYADFETFGNSQIKWLKKFIKLKNGIPSHDTFLRVFHLLKPESLEKVYRHLVSSIKTKGKHIAIDGKASCGCYKIKGECLLRTVSAWDTETGVAIGQLDTKNADGKEVGEYNTIPELVKTLDVKGTLVTVDAGGCYTNIVESIVEGKGDYAITLKENQPKLYEAAEAIFSECESHAFEGIACYKESDSGHGRVEERAYYAVPIAADSELRKRWSKLETLVMGRFRCRENGKEAKETTRYYISSLQSDQVKRIGVVLRSHWGIENSLHWVLDVSFGEDGNRTRTGHGAENLTRLRRLAIGMLNQVKGKRSITNSMFQASLDQEFRTIAIQNFLMR